MLNECLDILKRAEAWRAVRFAHTQIGVTREALTNSNGNQATTITKKEGMLRPGCVPPNEHDQYFE
jgi:hypothetical protein